MTSYSKVFEIAIAAALIWTRNPVSAVPDWSSLASSLSSEAALHGPFDNSGDSYEPCLSLGIDAFKISKENYGICMHAHACQYDFCDEQFGYDLPSYTVEAKTESDIVSVFAFADDHDDIPSVSVKTTGHSYQGSSTQKGSLMIWLQNYEKDLSIKKNYTNSCSPDDDKKLTHDVISIKAGAVWDDVIEAVKGDYHVVTGGGRTVSAIGGWLQGGGLSFSSRKYGIGVDQVLDFTVVLTNGTVVTADACTNPDLFWALRGGGGGTFGVVTHVHYKVYDVTPIVKLEYYSGIDESLLPEYGVAYEDIVEKWFDFWIEKSPTIEPEWCGGFFGAEYAHLLYCGSKEDAEKSPFYSALVTWYYTKLPFNSFIQDQWGSAIIPLEVYDSWYDYRGGAESYQNPCE